VVRTLYAYISLDLARITAMALAAFTLVMTVFGVAEPLREQGLSGPQVLSLFGFTVPIMLSLTLPIAALFAATFVYGRLSQSNELLAARASGISPVTLLKPALVLGGLVTVLSLVLSNYVTPTMASRAGRFVMANVEGIAYKQLSTRNYWKDRAGHIVHASEVHPEKRSIRGVVAADVRDPDSVTLLIAPEARMAFTREEGESYATFHLRGAAIARGASYDLIQVGETSVQSLSLPNMAREKPAWYSWSQLRRVLEDPGLHSEIHRQLVGIRRQICRERLSGRIIRAINRGGTYVLTDGVYDYEVSAGGAELRSRGGVRLSSKLGEDDVLMRVRVVRTRRGRDTFRKTISSDSASILADTPDEDLGLTPGGERLSRHMQVSVELAGHVTVEAGAEGTRAEPARHREWGVTGLKIPEDILEEVENIDLKEIYRDPKAYIMNAAMLTALPERVAIARGKVKAEMHGRIAYGLSCCLLVALGAALGLVFRGGHLLSAFALSVIPAALVIVLMVMGQEMVANPDANPALGLGAIWSGLVLVLVANLFVYARLTRR
jgi:lipopolysaccharide export system permease protein